MSFEPPALPEGPMNSTLSVLLYKPFSQDWSITCFLIFCMNLGFNKHKNSNLRSVILLKKSLWHRCFPVNFGKFLRTPFFTEHLRWLLRNSDEALFMRKFVLCLEWGKWLFSCLKSTLVLFNTLNLFIMFLWNCTWRQPLQIE